LFFFSAQNRAHFHGFVCSLGTARASLGKNTAGVGQTNSWAGAFE